MKDDRGRMTKKVEWATIELFLFLVGFLLGVICASSIMKSSGEHIMICDYTIDNISEGAVSTDTYGKDITDYPIKFDFDCNGKCNPDGSDIRVVNETSSSIIPFGLNKINDTAFNIAFKVNITGDIYIYYGNTDANPANISWDEAFYNLYDHFRLRI